MKRERPYEAVISDMDGVLTRTAQLHERAWKRMFDEFLEKQSSLEEQSSLQGQSGQRPFSRTDYRAHVDGKPRYHGVADFLSSRGIQRPAGHSSDPPSHDSVCGLGNLKNRYFLELLDQEGAEVYQDAVAAIERWRRDGMKAAAISSSRNCRRIMESVGIEWMFDAIVGGEEADALGLQGKPEILLEAARQLEVDPSDAAVLEDAIAGVEAGKRTGFALVAGISRNGNRRGLLNAGADVVVTSPYRLRLHRHVPNALARFDELASWRDGRKLAVFLDFDGTLAPIVDDPGQAGMTQEMRATLTRLAARMPVAVISGRDRLDVTARVDVDGLLFAGSHGLDIGGEGREKTFPHAEAAIGEVDDAETTLRRGVGQLSGVIIERKRFSIAIHYRQADTPTVVSQVEEAASQLRDQTGLRIRRGKKVIELEPDIAWDKGHALQWLMDVLEVDTRTHLPIYIGDDETDEDAFAVFEGQGVGVYVGGSEADTLAEYRLKDPDEVRELLKQLAKIADAEP